MRNVGNRSAFASLCVVKPRCQLECQSEAVREGQHWLILTSAPQSSSFIADLAPYSTIWQYEFDPLSRYPQAIRAASSDIDLAIFRLVQECLTNVHRHSESTAI